MPPEPTHDAASSPAVPPKRSRHRPYVVGIAGIALATVIVVLGISTRKMADARLREWTENQAIPSVSVIKPDTRAKRTTIELPGRLEAYAQAQMYSRVAGYLKEWKADIGASVKAGDLLAEVDAPELDKEIMQAEANVASAQAMAALANSTLQRGQMLSQTGSVSKQDLDNRAADFSNKQNLSPLDCRRTLRVAIQAGHRDGRRQLGDKWRRT